MPQEERHAFIRQDGGREWVFSLEYVSPVGKSLKTFLIVKGTYLKEDYFDSASEITIHTSNKGWTLSEIALTWSKHHFKP
jgi:hypothetical protein